MASGNTKGINWLVSIEAPKEMASSDDLEAINKILLQYQSSILDCHEFYFVATIIHDKDTKEGGGLRRPHVHFYLDTEETTLSKVLKTLTDAIGGKKEQISIEPTNSEILGVQYLTHKNQNKHKYNFEDIKTTNLEKLTKRYEAEYTSPQQEKENLENALRTASDINELVDILGASTANKYRGLFKDMKEARTYKTQLDRLQDGYDALAYKDRKLKKQIKEITSNAKVELKRLLEYDLQNQESSRLKKSILDKLIDILELVD